jgi:ribose transport system substrate-binding protein
MMVSVLNLSSREHRLKKRRGLAKSGLKRLYHIPILSKALDILELLQAEDEPLALEALYQRTRISKTSVYRILKTFVHRGYVAQTENGLYRLATRPRKIRFGFGGQSEDLPFSQAVTESLRAAAASSGVDLMILDNHYDAATAIRNAEQFVANRVDLVIEFQIEQQVAPIVADKIADAGIPLIAVEIPHPHAIFFGVNNYRAGFEAGEYLAIHARQRWDSKASWVIGLDIEEAGPLVQSRITGAFEGVRSVLPDLPIEAFVRMDGRGLRDRGYKLTADFLRRHPKDRGLLIAATTDTSALGALQAVREAKREKHVAIVGQDCIPEALEEMTKPNSPFIGSVSHEVNTYGARLIHLGLAMIKGDRIPPYNYVNHKLFTAKTILASE